MQKKVIIIGCGFGGLEVAKKLANKDCTVTIIDRSNHHLFQPLLYQVATADLSPAEIAWPIRDILSHAKNITVLQDDVIGVDKEEQMVTTRNAEYSYDYLVVASGAQNAYFGNDQWEQVAPGLKSLDDALRIRQSIFAAFEKAELSNDPQEQQCLMTFVVIGGGPTGVEMVGAIAEIARSTLKNNFRNIDPSKARIFLIEGGKQVLNGFDGSLANYTATALQKLGAELIFEHFVKDVQKDRVILKDRSIEASTIVWAAGVRPQVSAWLNVDAQRDGRIAVSQNLQLSGYQNIFIIGDAARVKWKADKFVPGIAPAAKQQGKYAGKYLRYLLKYKDVRKVEKYMRHFKYSHAGNLATIGRHKAVVDMGFMKFKGWVAWFFWGGVHILFLIRARSAVVVGTQWFWSYLTNRKPARLITNKAFLSPKKNNESNESVE